MLQDGLIAELFPGFFCNMLLCLESFHLLQIIALEEHDAAVGPRDQRKTSCFSVSLLL